MQLQKVRLFSVIFSCLFSSLVLASVEFSGEEKQGGLITGKTLVGTQAKLNGKPLIVSSDGHFAFGFGRDEEKSYELSLVYPDGSSFTRRFTPEKRQYNIQKINGIPKKIMNPNPAAVKRSRLDNKQIGEARASLVENAYFAQGFIAPIDGQITGVYGSQRVFNGEKKRPHFGLDYAGNTGDPVKAPADGIVTLFVPDMFYSGGTMVINHGLGVTSTFLHLSKSYVKVGDKVTQGQLVAAVGASGRATGPHLDWRVNWFNTRLDPAFALKNKPLK